MSVSITPRRLAETDWHLAALQHRALLWDLAAKATSPFIVSPLPDPPASFAERVDDAISRYQHAARRR